MTTSQHRFRLAHLRAGVAPLGLALAFAALPAVAQSQSTTPPAPETSITPTDQTPAAGPDIVVTGTLFRNASAATASPVTVLSSQDLANRGINTVADAIQSLSANNGGTLNSNWSQFGFPKGASAPSLRGLTDGRTLTLFDGLRSAPYPLADDGYRNFVDINTIPDSIVDRVEVLQDGASSTYGADAVAGVVNVIVKKQITGLHLNGSGGVSQQGDATEQRLDGTFGYGKLSENGFNIYVNGEYQKNDPLFLRDRGAPYGTADLSSRCGSSIGAVNPDHPDPSDPLHYDVKPGDKTCMFNGVANGIQADGSYGGFATTSVNFVRPYAADGSAAIPGSTYQLLNPALGCQGLTPYTLTPTQHSGAGASAPSTVCQEDLVKNYYQYSGRVERLGANAHATVNIGSRAQAYAMFNFYQTRTYNPLTPQGFANQTAAGGTQVTVSPILLPTYVCPLGGGNATYDPATGIVAAPTPCTAANGTLNPNNPFAAAGQLARLSGRYDMPTEDDTVARSFRYTAGISGSFGNDWNYAVDATHSDVFLKYTSKNYLQAQHLLNVIADGSYNFVDQSLNSQAARDYLSPTQVTNSVSRLTLIQASLSHGFFQLPGGPLQVAAGISYRKESIDNPSSNPANEVNPYDRYYGINAVGVEGSRNVKSAYFEIDAPIVNMLSLKATGRYDDYSSGQKNFSPKFEAQFKPIKELKLRGTFSKGFAIPSFNEAFGLPTTGYIGTQIDATSASGQAFLKAHSPDGTVAHADAYATAPYSYGLTSIGNPAVKPEKSTQFTAGVVLDPVRWLTFTVDYYNIKIKNLITTPDCSAAVDQYYSNNGVTNVPGCTTIKGVPDQDPQFAGALPLLGGISSFYTNANSLQTSGLDFTALARIPLGHGIRLTSNLNASYLIDLEQNIGGTIYRYDGTLSPCNITSCSGSPKWRGSWENTLDFNNHGTLSATVNYTSGYDLESIDPPYSGTRGDCLGSIGSSVVTYNDGVTPVSCHTKRFIDVDMSGSIKVADKFTLYVNVLNILNTKPPFDPSAGYSLYQFNPAWAGAGFIGRYFRFGAKVDF